MEVSQAKSGADDTGAVSHHALGAAAAEHTKLAPVKIDPDTYYPEVSVAELLGVKVETMRKKRRLTSLLPFSKYGHRVFYRGSDIIAMLDRSRQRSTSDARA